MFQSLIPIYAAAPTPPHPFCFLLTAAFSLCRLQGSLIKQSASGWLDNHWQLLQLELLVFPSLREQMRRDRNSWKRRMERLQTQRDWGSSYLALPNSRIHVSMKSELGNDKVEFYSWEMLSVSSCKNRIWKAQEATLGWCGGGLVQLELFSHFLLCL